MTKKFKIFVLDDEETITEIVTEFIEMAIKDTKVVTLNSSDVAIEHLSHNKYDLIVTDHQMPGQSGMSVLEKIRVEKSINYSTPVIFLSATHAVVQRELSSKFENVTVFNKVDSLHEVGNIVKNLLVDS